MGIEKGLSVAAGVKLNSGRFMPKLGLGVYLISNNGPCYEAVRQALDCGYRLFDTAKLYNNESDVGRAVKESGLPREEIFITTKLWNSDHGFTAAKNAFNASLKRLGLDYIDLYLIHWPVEGLRGESWKALEHIYKEAKAKSVGVSNYTVRHLKELMAASGLKPAVNQVEFSPFLYQKELLEFCQGQGIVLQAYSPLTQGLRLNNQALKKAASKYSKTPAQVVLRWDIQHGVVPIPKTVRLKRMRENTDIFDFNISQEDLDFLDTLNLDLHMDWDPRDVK